MNRNITLYENAKQLLSEIEGKSTSNDNEPILRRYLGLCSNLNLHSCAVDHFTSWKHFSGNLTYPVSLLNSDPKKLYEYYSNDCYEGEYGEMRIRLLNHIIKNTKRQINVASEAKTEDKSALIDFSEYILNMDDMMICNTIFRNKSLFNIMSDLLSSSAIQLLQELMGKNYLDYFTEMCEHRSTKQLRTKTIKQEVQLFAKTIQRILG
ncbi:hypothetical protein VmeM32_00243 [Vibrio phage vB_VmeM-32]|nr:hypothetical protein VmeM32_00243 [Vibrio phage vB_VmeM-32]